jgi:hypothetical protein
MCPHGLYDATGDAFGRFYGYEKGTIPAMDSLKRYIKKRGLPMSVYLDKYKTYKSTAKPSIQDELNDVEALSDFERGLDGPPVFFTFYSS